jgi:PAS domain S-box-containing protein
VKRTTLSERALVLAPLGRDASIAVAMLAEAGIEAEPCLSLPAVVDALDLGAAFVIATEEALATADLTPLAAWLADQEEWSDLPFILLTLRGGGLERNPAARRFLDVLGNVTFLERPFHPTTLISLARSALRNRRRQYEARRRLVELREGEERLRLATEAAEVGFWDVDLVNDSILLPERVRTMFGIAPDAAVSTADFFAGLHPADIERNRDAFAAAADPQRRALYEIEYRTVGKQDGLIRWVAAKGRGVFDEEGRCVRMLGTALDITDRKLAEANLRDLMENLELRVEEEVAERGKAEEQLRQAQKMEALGKLTGGVAHDFNNLLSPITGALDMLQRRHSAEDERTAKLLAGALQSAERAKALVQRLLGFARQQSLETSIVDLGALVDGMRDLIASSTGPTIEVRVEVNDDLPPALVDPNQLELALLNLCVNARDAMPSGGTLTIVSESVDVTSVSALELAAGRYVRLSITDTGTGMDEATIRRAVEPFFSTKELGKGTGLGLSMVSGLMAQLGGAMELSSALGKGTRIDLYFPAAEVAAAAQRKAAAAPARVAASQPLALLLVDDEALVRTGTAEMLRELGHKVVEASGAVPALEFLEAGLEVDAIVTDYKMPRMDGAALAQRVRALRPSVPILIISGYAGGGGASLDWPMLAKPFRQTDLAAAIAGLFDGRDERVRPPVSLNDR